MNNLTALHDDDMTRKLQSKLKSTSISFIQSENNALIHASKCSECGDILNGGTYGFIYNKINNPNIVIKSSIETHSTELSNCPVEFQREFQHYSDIADVFPRQLKTIKLIQVHGNMYVENQRCYYQMDKIFPLEWNPDQLIRYEQKLEEMKFKTKSKNDRNDVIKQNLEILMSNRDLFMLVPGIPELYFSSGGGINSHWREVGYDMMLILFDIVGIDFTQFNQEMFLLLSTMIQNSIHLIDVEFILGCRKHNNIDGTESIETGIFIIDFDKVVKIPNTRPTTEKELSNILNQDMFSKEVKTLIHTHNKGGNKRNQRHRFTVLKKSGKHKHNKHKRKNKKTVTIKCRRKRTF